MVISPEEIKAGRQDKAKAKGIEKRIDEILQKAKNLDHIIIFPRIFEEVNSNVKEEIINKYKKAGWDVTYHTQVLYGRISEYIFKQKKK